jgi:hypothetical protein
MVSEPLLTNVTMSDSSSSASSSTLPTISSTPTFTYVKLGRDNYPSWRQQLLPFLQGHDVYGYVDGSISSPPKIGL